MKSIAIQHQHLKGSKLKDKTWIAYAITYGESACGCSVATHHKVYDETGNNYKYFKDKEQAEAAAIAKMQEFDADNWNVI